MQKIEEAGFVFQRKEYFTSVYQMEKFLGQGAFSKVFICSHIISADKYAVKIMEKRLLKSSMMDRYKQEIYMIKALDHPNIINVIEYFEDAERIYVIFELCKGGELY